MKGNTNILTAPQSVEAICLIAAQLVVNMFASSYPTN